MSLKVLPVAFHGVLWGHPDLKHGRKFNPQDRLSEKMDAYAEQLERVEMLELIEVNDRDEVPAMLKQAAEADVLLCVY